MPSSHSILATLRAGVESIDAATVTAFMKRPTSPFSAEVASDPAVLTTKSAFQGGACRNGLQFCEEV